MRSTFAVPGGLLALSLLFSACGDSGTEPSPTARMSVTDPAGDEYSTSASAGLVPPDITSLEAWPESDSLRIEVKFVNPVSSPAVDDANTVYGYLELDADHDPATGMPSIVDMFRPDGGSTGLGVDYFVSLFTSPIEVYGADFTMITTIPGSYDGNTLRLSVPLSAIGGGDGYVKMAIVVGTAVEPTDIAPNDGHLTRVAEAVVVPTGLSTGAPDAAARVGARRWGE